MKIVKKIIAVIFILIIGVCAYYTKIGYKMYRDALNIMSIEDKVQEIKSIENYVEFSELPQEYINAVIAVEDHRYYEHGAIDILSIVRAINNDIKARRLVEGGSTITQQLAKNIYFTQERKLERKIAEVFMAYELERNLSKDEIFELYVNTNYFGEGYYGIGAAAKGYYNKDVSELNSYECTMLAGIPNAPSVYAPTVNPELAERRRQVVVQTMAQYGY
ncbi:MAG: transglycosylase domain-containing protein [Clostridia bacterium]|nr:transglycosylase domain-containing protein [Clostridia bacterium]